MYKLIPYFDDATVVITAGTPFGSKIVLKQASQEALKYLYDNKLCPYITKDKKDGTDKPIDTTE